MTVSVVFLVEILGLLLVHLFHGQYQLFFRNSYYWYLLILGVGGVVAAVPVEEFYDPLVASMYPLVIFQVGRGLSHVFVGLVHLPVHHFGD